jgi:general secretion pathway protein D
MIKPPFIPLCAFVCLSGGALFAGTYGESTTTTTTTTESIAEREIVRRQENVIRAQEALTVAKRAMEERDYEVAAAQYKIACDLLPPSPHTDDLRDDAVEGFCEASIRLAEQRIAEGRFKDAETAAKTVLDERYDPHCKEARELLANLEDPDYYNKTITPKFQANVEEVKRLLVEAEGFYSSGRYDFAHKRYEQVLNIDPYNIAARKGQERVHLARDNYAIEAYNEHRAKLLWQIDKAWESPVRKFNVRESGQLGNVQKDLRGTEYITNKLNRIILPRVEFAQASVREAITFLQQRSKQLDTEEPDPARKGVNIVLRLETAGQGAAPAPAAPAAPTEPAIPGLEVTPATPAAPAAPAALVNPNEAQITLSITNVPLIEALRYVTEQAGLKFKIDPYAVSVVPLTVNTDALITKEYRVPPSFIASAPAADGGGGGAASDPLAAPATSGTASRDATGAGSNIRSRQAAKDFLAGNGVTFPPGASAVYLPSSSRLIVRNTQENLDLIDTLVENFAPTPSQVEIESKFVEITQNNLKELSFDFLLGQANIPGTSGVFGGGGTSGTATGVDPSGFPFIPPNGAPIGQFPVTGANRTGNLAISPNAIDALLFPSGTAGASPAALALAGVFTDPQFQLVVRALNQKKGVDLLSAPRVTAKSGQRAVIEIIREFRYPTEFDPPQIPERVDNINGGGTTIFNPLTNLITSTGNNSSGAFPVTPTTPTAFETRNTGVTLEVEPTVGPDGYTIDLNLVPQVVEFEGFINYGSPIQTTSTNALGVTTVNVLTPNIINQPIFSTRKVTTSVSIWDGQTVVLGGLMREDIQKVEDKIPVLGDLPLIGRVFRSNVDQHLKRNLIIFVTARLMNPAGEPILQQEEEEEVVEETPPVVPEAPLFPK